MDTMACLNGEIMPVEQARVPVWDRGFLFGDAVYEVWRTYRGRCWLEREHLARSAAESQGARVPAGRPGTVDGSVAPHDRGERDSGRDRLCANYARCRAEDHAFPDPPVPPTELIMVRPYDDGPTARLRETGASHDQSSRPALEAMRRQVDEPAGECPGDGSRAPGGLPGSRAGRFRGTGHRGDAFVADLGA